MPISFTCSSCEKVLKTRDEMAGKRVKCPGCGTAVVVPATAASLKATVSPPPQRAGASPSRRADMQRSDPVRLPRVPQPEDANAAPSWVDALFLFDLCAVLFVLAVVLYMLTVANDMVGTQNYSGGYSQSRTEVSHDFKEFVITSVLWAGVGVLSNLLLLKRFRFGFWLAIPALLLTAISQIIRLGFLWGLQRKLVTTQSPLLYTLKVGAILWVLYLLAVLAYHALYVRALWAVRREMRAGTE